MLQARRTHIENVIRASLGDWNSLNFANAHAAMWGATRPIVMLKITADTISFDFPFSPNAESTFMPIANVEGSDIHYSRTGNGPPMTMLLPQSSGPVGVTPFLDCLRQQFSVIRYDQRGTGKSAPVPSPEAMSMTGRAGEVHGLLDALDIDRSWLCCHSTGCGIGFAAAAAQSERIIGLVFVSPWSFGDAHLTTMQNLRVAAARGLNPYRYAWFNASLLFPPDYRREHHTGFEEMAQSARSTPQDADAIEDRLQAILAFDARPTARSIECPTLICASEDDQLMPVWFARELAGLMPAAQLLSLQGGGHMLPETRGETIAQAIIEFTAAHTD